MITNLFAKLVQIFVALIGLMISGCSPVTPHITAHDDSYGQNCLQLYRTLDRSISEAGTRDSGNAQIDGFPHLRIDRFLSTFADHRLSTLQLSAWLDRLRKLDYSARLYEYANLPQLSREQLAPQIPNRLALEIILDQCGRYLVSNQLKHPDQQQKLFEKAHVPDSYIQWNRVAGLYPIVRLFARIGVEDLHEELSKNFKTDPAEIPVSGHLERYSPISGQWLNSEQIQNILAKSSKNPLKIPEPSSKALNLLFDTFAPIWEIDMVNEQDNLGAISIDKDAQFQVDRTKPHVYKHVSYTTFGGKPLLQLNYVVWFPAREKESSIDLYGGRFDGLIWRVTLGADGHPLAYDSIHPCGCYYLILPRKNMQLIPPGEHDEPVLSPDSAPDLQDQQRVVIRIAHRTHYIDHVYAAMAKPQSTVYALKNYSNLLSLKSTTDQYRSFFNEYGLVPDSERLERFILWPLGVRSAGAMRQWGTHAIAFIGKRHFDDPHLMESLIKPM